MSDANAPRRRFAPVPIETTFQSVRRTKQPDNIGIGPNAELTPDASPRTPSPVPRELGGETRPNRRFAPQLIETSRRTRRVGDAGPATKPTDKTDITPYTKNIYTTKLRHRRRIDSVDDENHRPAPPTRRESEDESVKAYLLELAAKEAERQIQETALAAFPNSHAREGGIAHFYFHEGSESDEFSPHESISEEPRAHKSRRKSSNLGLGWWHKHMQDHVQDLSRRRGDTQDAVFIPDDRDTAMMSDTDLDNMDLALPPDPLWTTTSKVSPDDRRDSMAESPLISSRPLLDEEMEDQIMSEAPPSLPRVPSEKALAPTPKVPAETSFKGFGRPFPSYLSRPDPQARKMRKLASPPMLGKDLVFRQCPSPKFTKMEPTQPFTEEEDPNRDVSGQQGLWHGYCFNNEPPAERNLLWSPNKNSQLMVTPRSPGTPSDSASMSEEPASLFSPSGSIESASTVENRGRSREVKGLHMLHGLDERLQREKADAEVNEKIAQEFDDEFVTQVYNYLSLGYPALAGAYDEELSKISHISIYDLRQNDSKELAEGHMFDMSLDDVSEEQRCPRWRALKVYIYEWARQHPDLNALDPVAWGVRERRGSWAI